MDYSDAPEGVWDRAFARGITTDVWPELDAADLVPDFDGPAEEPDLLDIDAALGTDLSELDLGGFNDSDLGDFGDFNAPDLGDFGGFGD